MLLQEPLNMCVNAGFGLCCRFERHFPQILYTSLAYRHPLAFPITFQHHPCRAHVYKEEGNSILTLPCRCYSFAKRVLTTLN